MSETDVINAVVNAKEEVVDALIAERHHAQYARAIAQVYTIVMTADIMLQYMRHMLVTGESTAAVTKDAEMMYYVKRLTITVTDNWVGYAWSDTVLAGMCPDRPLTTVSWAVTTGYEGDSGYPLLNAVLTYDVPYLNTGAWAYIQASVIRPGILAGIVDYNYQVVADPQKFLNFETEPETTTQYVSEWLKDLLPQWMSKLGGPR